MSDRTFWLLFWGGLICLLVLSRFVCFRHLRAKNVILRTVPDWDYGPTPIYGCRKCKKHNW